MTDIMDRNKDLTTALRALQLTAEAQQWLINLYDTIQFFDDVADGDYSERRHLNDVLQGALVSMPLNAFYLRNIHALGTAVTLMVLKWQASDNAERNNRADEMSFMWRGGYYDVVLLCHALENGYQKTVTQSEDILRLYGENFPDYAVEFSTKGDTNA